MRLVLFDVDGTLILTGGAGMRAFYRAFGDVFGIAVEHEVVRPDGKTDPLIAREILAYFRQESRWDEHSREALFASYLDYLESEMRGARENGTLLVLGGVIDLLDVLRSTSSFTLGLVTGNLESGARIKLSHAGLWKYFAFGGYGSDSEDRTALIRTAIERGRRHVAPAAVDRVFVIGDTPFDIIHARAAGVRAVGVASGRHTVDDLRRHDPDLVVSDLSATDTLLRFLNDA